MSLDQFKLGSAEQALFFYKALQSKTRQQQKRNDMSPQEKRPDLQKKQSLDTLAGKRLQQAKYDLLRQAGVEITTTVAKLNQQAIAEKARETSKDN